MRLTLGTTLIQLVDGGDETLACTFKVTKNLKAEPNKVEIKVWNLARDTRKALETPKAVVVQLDVGYGTDLHTIYLGQLRAAISAREGDGTDIVTSISSGDSEDAFGFGRCLVSVPAKASPAKILASAFQGLQAAGVGAGNVQTAQGQATASYNSARVLHGNAAKVADDVTRANGMEWSVQNGKLQILPIGAAVGEQAVLLNSDTGMVGTPSVDTKGVLKVRALIQPDLEPGRLVQMDAEFVKGTYRIEEAEYSGETWGDDWTVELTGRKRT
jgi:hypothetical protein